MAFRNWHIGIHIQQDCVVIVALLYERSCWGLRRWWSIPLAPGIVRQGMVVDIDALVERLREWRRELPLQYRVSIAWPADRTLQKRLPQPQVTLRERERVTWITSVMAQQLEMPAASLSIDYAEAPTSDGWYATAARRMELDTLRRVAQRLKLRVDAIVPDASALCAFFPRLPSAVQGLAWRDSARWLWASQARWGYCLCSETPSFHQLASRLELTDLLLCVDRPDDVRGFDCWSVIHRLQPPLPVSGGRFAIALGLAMSGARHG